MVGPIVGISYKMLPASISNVVTSFANKGINMHIFSGNAVCDSFHLIMGFFY